MERHMTDAILERLESRAAISDLIHLYALNIRNGNPAKNASLFTEDAIFEVRRSEPAGCGAIRTVSRSVGRDEVMASITHSSSQARVCPLIHNLLIDVQGNEAASNAMMIARVLDKGMALLGEYQDRFRREDCWRFSSRIYTIIGQLGPETPS
jgi:hypothetical protein